MNYSAENDKLIRAAKGGDYAAYEKLLKINERLCYHIANRFKNVDDIEDLVSIAKIGLIKAYKNFDLDKGIKFVTYASKLIHNEILMHNRKMRRHKNNVSLDSVLTVDFDGSELTLIDVLPAEIKDTHFEDYDGLKAILDMTLKQLSERDRKIFKMYFFERMKQQDIANKFNIAQSYISRLIKKIIKELQNNSIKTGFIEGGTKMKGSKIEEKELFYVFNHYPEMKNSDVAKVFNIHEATVSKYKTSYKEKLKNGLLQEKVPSEKVINNIIKLKQNVPDSVFAPIEAIYQKSEENNTSIPKENDKNSVINEPTTYNSKPTKEESIFETYKKIKDKNIKIKENTIISTNRINVTGKDTALIFLLNYVNMIEQTQGLEVDVELNMELKFIKK